MTQIQARDLRAGMKIKDGRIMRTITRVTIDTIAGGNDFADYETVTVYVDGPRVFAPNRGMVPASAQFDADKFVTILEEVSA